MRSGLLAAGLTMVLAAVSSCGGAERPAAQPTAPPSTPTTVAERSQPTPEPSPTPTGPEVGDGEPRDASLTIPALDIVDLPVIAYEGFTDDAPGTVIQDRGDAASPYGPEGGVGPGGIGNYQVTAHRLSSTQAFLDLPDLVDGDRIEVVADGTRYVYEVTQTRETSFRSAESLAEQRAAVPGEPGVEPDRASITLSTCATQEDRAAGNYWTDEFGNPEHRIDKIGELVETEPA